MPAKPPTEEDLDLALEAYAKSGCSCTRAAEALKAGGRQVSGYTLGRWARENDFNSRLGEIVGEWRRLRAGAGGLERQMLMDLIRQKEKYEKYFESNPGIDNGTEYTYSNIIKAVIGIGRKVDSYSGKSPEELRRIADEILENEFGIKP